MAAASPIASSSILSSARAFQDSETNPERELSPSAKYQRTIRRILTIFKDIDGIPPRILSDLSRIHRIIHFSTSTPSTVNEGVAKALRKCIQTSSAQTQTIINASLEHAIKIAKIDKLADLTVVQALLQKPSESFCGMETEFIETIWAIQEICFKLILSN